MFTAIIIIMVFTAGTALMMWLGEQINDKGIGNGISILLFAGIVSRLPTCLLYTSAAPAVVWLALPRKGEPVPVRREEHSARRRGRHERRGRPQESM